MSDADFTNAAETGAPPPTGLSHSQVEALAGGSEFSNAGGSGKPPPTGMSSSQIAALVAATPGQAGIRLNTNVGITAFFTVTIDTVDLGSWSKCTGLGMKIDTKPRSEAGMTLFQHQLPGHLVFEHITLERPLTRDSRSVLNWFMAYHMLPIPTSGQITAVDQTGSPVMTWELTAVTPVAWKGPNLDATAGTANVATEALTIAHTGFF